MDKSHQQAKYWHLDKKDSHHISKCLKNTLEKILNEQRKVNKKETEKASFGCLEPLGMPSTNTIPFILYSHLEPVKFEGVTKCFDNHLKKEKFVCFSTFIFRIIDLEGDYAVLELLKFKNPNTCIPDMRDHVCSLNCQLDLQEIDDLIATSVYIEVELSCFNAIQCLPAVFL